MANLAAKLSSVVGDRTAKVLSEELGLETLEDLLRHYPRRYEVRGELTNIESLNERWFDAMITGPCEGTFRRPLTFGRKSSVRTGSRKDFNNP